MRSIARAGTHETPSVRFVVPCFMGPGSPALRAIARDDNRVQSHSYLQRGYLDPTPFGPALQPQFRKLHALGAFHQIVFPRCAGDHMADEILPLDLEAVFVGD